MSDRQISRFDDQLLVVRYYENEHLCIDEISSPQLISLLAEIVSKVPAAQLNQLLRHNSKDSSLVYDQSHLHDLVVQGALSFAFVIAGQGPKAFGMPEMFTPSQNLKHHKFLEASSLLVTDGRYSGVTKGACIGHVTPEAIDGGGIGCLDDGDILHFSLRENRLDVVDPKALSTGAIVPLKAAPDRVKLTQIRKSRMLERMEQIAASNQMSDVTNAERGCVPGAVDLRARNPLP
jgi:dihydroxyacid dehydratase/phosphogluconate dehydratase